MGGGTATEASTVAPMPGVLGDESSSSDGEDCGGDNVPARNNTEIGSVDRGPSTAKDEPEHELLPTWPLNPMPLIGSRRDEDIEMDVAKATLFLGECSLASWFYSCVSVLCLL